MKRLIGKATVIAIFMFLSLSITSVASETYIRTDWMGLLDNYLHLSDLSIPGTHDTMSLHENIVCCWTKCQTMTLEDQLNAGIRAFDIRLSRWRECPTSTCEFKLRLWHGMDDQKAFFDSDVLEVCIQFLRDHPNETILMRIKKEEVAINDMPDKVWWGTMQSFEVNLKNHISAYRAASDDYVYDYVYGWNPTNAKFEGVNNPILKDIRGKIVILDNVEHYDTGNFGILWELFDIQDAFEVWQTSESMNTKWTKIRNHIDKAMTCSPGEEECPINDLYINFTSGSTHMWPKNCALGFLGFFMWIDGQNNRTYWYLKQCYKGVCPPEGRYIDNGGYGRIGLIMSDFPSDRLIDVIIAHNGLPMMLGNNLPVADANGPYLADEGSLVTFDASGSTDAENDPMQYRWEVWDVDVDGDLVDLVFETEWSSDPFVTMTWYDDFEGVALVEVHDGEPSHWGKAAAKVKILNVAPTVAIESIISPVKGCILPGQGVAFIGSFTDPGCLDTHTAKWDYGDGSTESGTLTEENDVPDATGSVSGGHTYGEPGIFKVSLEIEDDDLGIGAANVEVKVMTASEALDFADSFIQNLPESCFKRPADNRKNAFSNKFNAVKNALGAGDIRGAINKLMNDIRAKADGSVDGKSSNDWITDGEARGRLCLVIDELVKYLASL
jgi:hypothetical protein